MDKRKYENLLKLRLSQEMLFYELLTLLEDKKTVREVIELVQMPRKRAIYILQKWCYKGYYDYGVGIVNGWLTYKFPTWDIRR